MKNKKNRKILGIIPARGGSKGLPEKNIKKIAGKPLIAWSIEEALKSEHIDKLIVSTEDKKIAKIARQYNGEVMKRPKKLAKDNSPVMDAVKDTLRKLRKENYIPDIIIILQPTSPLRTVITLDSAVETFLKNIDQYDSLIPLFPTEGKIGKIKNGLYLPSYTLGENRQRIKRVYRECGTIFILKADLIYQEKGFGRKIYPFIIKDYKESIDIDTIDDFKIAEYFLERK